MDDVMGELEGDPFIGAQSLVERDGSHGGFEIDEMQGVDPAGHLDPEIVPVDPYLVILLVGHSELEQLALALREAWLVGAFLRDHALGHVV